MPDKPYDYSPGANFLADHLASLLLAMKAVNEARKIKDAESEGEPLAKHMHHMMKEANRDCDLADAIIDTAIGDMTAEPIREKK